MVTEVKNSLESFGESPDDLTPPKQGEYLLKTLSKFASNVTDIVDGKGSDVGVEMQELCGEHAFSMCLMKFLHADSWL